MGIRCNAGPLETFALFWYLFVSVGESHYESLTLLPHMGCVVDNFGNISRARPPLPSFQFNLLHQKLSLLNCCIEEKLNNSRYLDDSHLLDFEEDSSDQRLGGGW